MTVEGAQRRRKWPVVSARKSGQSDLTPRESCVHELFFPTLRSMFNVCKGLQTPAHSRKTMSFGIKKIRTPGRKEGEGGYPPWYGPGTSLTLWTGRIPDTMSQWLNVARLFRGEARSDNSRLSTLNSANPALRTLPLGDFARNSPLRPSLSTLNRQLSTGFQSLSLGIPRHIIPKPSKATVPTLRAAPRSQG
jgi:hypothetical protein